MVIIKTFQIDKNIEVVCEAKRTRNGFKHTATLLLNGIERDSAKCCYLNRTWERYEFESVLEKLADKATILSESERKKFRRLIKNYKEDSGLGSIAMVAKMGDIFGKTQKEKNDWKARMLKAGLENKGLIMPDDWDQLNEKTKQTRLDKVIEELI